LHAEIRRGSTLVVRSSDVHVTVQQPGEHDGGDDDGDDDRGDDRGHDDLAPGSFVRGSR
jgi:hypothetical protein